MNIVNQATRFTRKNLNGSEKSKKRDFLLDFAKGMAIILVVLGHTFQGRAADFDSLYGFRFIYAFHMPFFVFLSGAAASHWVSKFSVTRTHNELRQASIYRIRRAAVQLWLPFLAWTLVAFILGGSEVSLTEYLKNVFLHADRSLWFLPCIFWCTAYTSVFMLLATSFRKWLEGTSFLRFARFMAQLPVQMLILFVVWNGVRFKLPGALGLVFANQFHGGLFLFYLLGIVFFKPFVELKSKIARVLPYVIFFALVPYWHRTMPHNVIQGAPDFLSGGWMQNNFAFIVAIAGSLAVLDLSRILNNLSVQAINASMLYLGTASLGVYAMHFYYIAYQPQVIAPILISLILYQLISYVPLVRTFLLGK